MGGRLIVPTLRHPLFALAGAVLFAAAAFMLIHGGFAARAQLDTTADDPVKITDQALDRVFSRDVAEREIRGALAADDLDLAQSFVALAADRSVQIDPALAAEVNDATVKHDSVSNTAGRFMHGLWTGEPTDLASLVGTVVGDLSVFGDIRDAAREGTRYLTGEKYDPWILSLAGVGIGITAGTYATFGAGTPERVGLSVVKAAKRTGRLNPALAVRAVREAVKVESAGGLIELAENTGRIESKAGAQAALDGLAIAEEPKDVSRLARLSAAKGGKTRAIVKILGRGAIVLAASALDLSLWVFWAALALFGFCSSCKATVEGLTLRHLQRRKLRLARAALITQPAMLAAPLR
ncbi:MAG: hypothetical protein WA837_14665 [Xanthobacteraceae bacterium]